VYEAEIMSRTARGPEKRTGIKRLTGDSINISEWLDFEFYDLVWFYTPGLKGPFFGQWLGVAHRVGGNLSYWILNSKANVLARTSVQHVTEQEMNNIDIQKKIDNFQTELFQKLEIIQPVDPPKDGIIYLQDVDIGEDEPEVAMAIEADDVTDEAYDKYVGAGLITTYAGDYRYAEVTKQMRDDDNRAFGRRHENPKLYTDVPSRLVGYQRIRCHMVFDVKMDNLARKARFVAGGHTTKTPASITYSSVVSQDSVRIAFLLAALNGMNVCVADVGNAYLIADCGEKIWTVAGPEFGSDAGAVMIVKKALYGLKSSGTAWRALFAST
jgi:hypothetical protein